MSDDLGRRVRAVVAATFGVPAASLTDESGAHSIEAWDSMNHIHLIVALEAELGVSFDPERAIELTTVGAIVQALRALGAR
jgi:acyl carrier protein